MVASIQYRTVTSSHATYSDGVAVHNALRDKGINSTRYVVSGADHGDLSFIGNTTPVKPWSTQETMNHIVDFLHQHLGG